VYKITPLNFEKKIIENRESKHQAVSIYRLLRPRPRHS